MTLDELAAQEIRQIQAKGPLDIVVEFGAAELLALCSLAQLGLRHPQASGSAARLARGKILQIIEALEPDMPHTAALMRQGFRK